MLICGTSKQQPLMASKRTASSRCWTKCRLPAVPGPQGRLQLPMAPEPPPIRQQLH